MSQACPAPLQEAAPDPFLGFPGHFLINDLLCFLISLNSAPTPACGSTSHLKSTPVATPCTPRRLSLAESFTNVRESTTTMSTSLGLEAGRWGWAQVCPGACDSLLVGRIGYPLGLACCLTF